MQYSFVGRKRELQMLKELFKKKSASLVVIRGRRRIGKSRLAQEFAQKTPHYIFSGLPPTNRISAADQREEFARQIHREMKTPPPRAEDWGDLFWHLSQQTKKGKIVLVLDEISWMGSKDPTFLGKLIVYFGCILNVYQMLARSHIDPLTILTQKLISFFLGRNFIHTAN